MAKDKKQAAPAKAAASKKQTPPARQAAPEKQAAPAKTAAPAPAPAEPAAKPVPPKRPAFVPPPKPGGNFPGKDVHGKSGHKQPKGRIFRHHWSLTLSGLTGLSQNRWRKLPQNRNLA